VLDTQKAPFWTIPTGLGFVARANAPRKTIVFGTISDMPGRGHKKYRRIAREALDVADRVLFVGPNSAAVIKQGQGELRERLFAFQTTYQASAFLAENNEPEELIFVKASVKDHLERIMLSQLDRVVCWRERCRVGGICPGCRYYRKPHAPPFGVAEDQPALVAAP
jgi:UDP-N-acetylmuramoyl-tripeptide--D-alanyl-D-alanine ligase